MMSTIGEKIRMMRLSINLTQSELADATQISMKSIQRFESNLSNPDGYNLVRLANFFDVTTDYLLGLYDSSHTLTSMKQNALPNHTYRALYEKYVRCKSQLPIPEKTYYWIFSETNDFGKATIGGQTKWSGWADKECRSEIRILREVDAQKAIAHCSKAYGAPLILHTAVDAYIFSLYGGHAIAEKSCCEQYLKAYLKPFIT